MLASPSKLHKNLWLVDKTGAYAVRALALGGVSHEINMSVNGKLRQVQWDQISSEDGLALLLEIASDCLKDKAPCAVEAAVVDFDGRRLVRKFLGKTD